MSSDNEYHANCDSTSMLLSVNPKEKCDDNSLLPFESSRDTNRNPYHLRSSAANSTKPRIKRKSMDDTDDIYIFPVSSGMANCSTYSPKSQRSHSSQKLSQNKQKAYDLALDSDLDTDEELACSHSNQKVSSSGVAINNDDDSVVPFNNAKTSPATIQWLLQHYEVAEGVSLPRHILYAHYLRHCHDSNVEPANSASFGKLIRSVFYGLKTRRLGTRGNSKYHYYGIRLKTDSSLHSSCNGYTETTAEAVENLKFDIVYKRNKTAPICVHLQATPPVSNFCAVTSTVSTPPRQTTSIPLDMSKCLFVFRLQSPLSVMNSHGALEKSIKALNRNQLFSICTLPLIQNFVREMDITLYQAFINVLVPDVLKPMTGGLIQKIRTFCKRLEVSLAESMQGAPEDIVKLKLDAVATLAHTLRRYTCLNHVAQTARAVLANSEQINQMLADLNRIDFRSLHAQASWACNCSPELISEIDTSFKTALEERLDLEQWASWLNSVIDRILSSEAHYPSSLDEFVEMGKRLTLKWSFYSSLIMRDLTLRSAVTFGSFHLMRLLYDEYVFYLIEQKICKITGQTVIAVMSPMKNFAFVPSNRLAGFSEIQYDTGTSHLAQNIGAESLLISHSQHSECLNSDVSVFNECTQQQSTCEAIITDGKCVIEMGLTLNVQSEAVKSSVPGTLEVTMDDFFATNSGDDSNKLLDHQVSQDSGKFLAAC